GRMTSGSLVGRMTSGSFLDGPERLLDRGPIQVPEQQERERGRGHRIAQVARAKEGEDGFDDPEEREEMAEHPAPWLEAPGGDPAGPERDTSQHEQPTP